MEDGQCKHLKKTSKLNSEQTVPVATTCSMEQTVPVATAFS